MNTYVPPPPPPPSSSPAPTYRPHPRRRRRGRRLLMSLLVLVILAGLGATALYLVFRTPTVDVEAGTWLDVALAGSYPEERQEMESLVDAFRADDISAQDLISALWRAAEDPRIEGVLLRPDLYRGGWAQAQEIREALAHIREEGKPVWAFLELPRSGAYYIATAVDSIAIAPEGALTVGGLSARMMYLRGTLDKLGVQADFVAIGEYKSAPEQFSREGPSQESREQLADYVDDVFDTWLAGLAEGRGLSRNRMAEIVDTGLYDSTSALEQGLVDQILDSEDLWARLQPGRDEAVTIDPTAYLRASWDPPGKVERGRHLALVYATGQIVPGSIRSGSGLMGSDTVVKRLAQAGDDDRVKAVVLRIDSPGGSVLASDLIWREIERVREMKPVVVSMGNLAASGGYYIAMSGDRILADPLTLTGSIGVYAGKMDLSGLYSKLGLSFEIIERGENASAFSDLQTFTPAQRRQLREHLESFYTRFISRVAAGRGMTPVEADAVARGRIWSGRRAQEVGLVDELGTLRDAIRVAKELAGIPPESKVPVHTYQATPSFLQRFLHDLLRQSGSVGLIESNTLAPLLASPLRRLAPFIAAMDGSPQFAMPWDLRIE